MKTFLRKTVIRRLLILAMTSILLLMLLFPAFAASSDPSGIAPLGLWLKADTGITLTAGRVSGWADQSGAGNNLTQATAAAQPAYIGAGINSQVIWELAGQMYMSIPTTLSINRQSYSAFMVVDTNDFSQSQQYLTFGGGQIDLFGQSTLGYWQGSFGATTSLSPYSHLSIIGITSSAAQTLVYLNDQVAVGSNVQAAGTYTGGNLGANGAPNAWFDGAYREVVVYPSTTLTPAQVQVLLSYFQARYGLNFNPLYSLTLDGDSLTWGYGSYFNANWAHQLGLSNEWTVRNFGISGQQIGASTTAVGTGGAIVAGMASTAAKIDAIDISTTAQTSVLTAFAGTNDIVSTGGNVTGTLAYARYVAYCQARKTAHPGLKILAFTLLPRPGNGGSGGVFETDRQAFNTLVRANWPSFADGLADVETDARIGAVGANTNAYYYYSDSTHLSSAGYSILAGIVRRALNKIVNPPVRPIQPL